MPIKKKPISDLYRDLIAPQISINEDAIEDMLEMDDDDSDIEGIISLLDDSEEKTITVTEDNEVIDNDEFYSNLVDVLPTSTMDEMYTTLADYVKSDKNARREKDRRCAKFFKRYGFSQQDKVGGAQFQGASDVTHNAPAVAMVDFCSRAIKEIAPVNGPVKSKIVGSASNDVIKLANKKVKFLNYTLTEQVPYREIKEVLLSQLFVMGSAFEKWSYNKRLKMPVLEFVPLDFLYLPIYTQDFRNADRITQKLKYSDIQLKKLVRDGIYSLTHVSEIGLNENDEDMYGTGTSYGDDRGSETEQVVERIDGVDDTSDSEEDEDEGVKTLYEVHLDLEIEEDTMSDGVLAPYIVTIDADENAVLGIYRNWDIEDKNLVSKKWFVEYKFIPFRGAYGIGAAELFDGTSAALNGILRALLDAGHSANFPTLLMLAGAGVAGQNSNPNPGVITKIEGPTGVDTDINKFIKQIPLAVPQPVLLELMQNLENQFSALFSATENLSDQMSQSRDMPVGTTLALLDESSKRMSAIHARLHKANEQSLKILCRILKENLTSVVHIEALGDAFIIKPEDFAHSHDIIPVSDPNIFSNSQRFAQLQAVAQLAQNMSQEYNLKELNRRMLQLIEVPDPEGLLNITQEAGNINAVAENSAALGGVAIQVFSIQSHLQHIIVHLEFLESTVYSNPMFLATGGQMLIQHIQKHVLELYNQVFNEFVVKNGQDQLDLTANTAEVDNLLAKFNGPVLKVIAKMLMPYQERLKAVVEAVTKAQPKPPQDPKIQETQMKIEAEQQLEQLRIQAQKEQMQSQLQVKQQELQTKKDLEQMTMQNQSQNDAAEIQMAQIKAQADIENARVKAVNDSANIQLGIIKTGAEIYEKDMEIQRDLQLNQHQQTLEEARHGFEVMSKGSDIAMEHIAHKALVENNKMQNKIQSEKPSPVV